MLPVEKIIPLHFILRRVQQETNKELMEIIIVLFFALTGRPRSPLGPDAPLSPTGP